MSSRDSLPPAYTRDPDTESIRSAAPSYTSAAPSYHSRAPSAPQLHHHHRHSQTTPRLPSSSHFAPGFTSRSSNPDIRDLEAHNYNISHWSNATSGPKARHYHSVASRRATVANAENAARRNAEMTVAAVNMRMAGLGQSAPTAGLDPLEDPYVVGTEMAAQARRERMKRRMTGEEGEEVLRREDKAWDFMIAQMADWEERERSWMQFRKCLAGKKNLLRRRVGAFGE